MIDGGKWIYKEICVKRHFHYLLAFPALVLYKRDKVSKINSDIKRFLHYTSHNECNDAAFMCLMSQDARFRSIFYYRMYKKKNILLAISRKLLPGLQTIEINGKIGGGLMIHHSFAIISPERAGKNLTVLPGVVIGRGRQDIHSGRLRPVLGDNVFVGANASVIGGITIGDNVTIGAGSVVTRDIPNDCTVAGIPAKIISKNKMERH